MQALGAAHLAALLMDIAEGDAALKRRLRMEIAGPEQAAAEVRKRLASLKRAKSYIEWNKTKALVLDLETQLGAITGKVDPLAPAEALAQTPVAVPPAHEQKVVGWGGHGETYAHELEASMRKRVVARALKDTADAQGDVDGYIALYDAKTRQAPAIAADIAARLLQAGRADEALAALDAATGNPQSWREWHSTRLQVLEALGQGEAAQTQRWQAFEAVLSAADLREYLKRLPDFEDIEAEERALDYALAFEPPEMALFFLCHWPALDHAAALVLRLGGTLDGNDYETLTALSDALSARHPLAATLALRAMISFALERARTKRYRHAARHLLECESLSAQIEDYGDHSDDAAYLATLKQAHGRKYSFWERVGM